MSITLIPCAPRRNAVHARLAWQAGTTELPRLTISYLVGDPGLEPGTFTLSV